MQFPLRTARSLGQARAGCPTAASFISDCRDDGNGPTQQDREVDGGFSSRSSSREYHIELQGNAAVLLRAMDFPRANSSGLG